MMATTPDLLKKIRRIQYHTTRLANDILAGAYKSAFKGRGMEFEEVREYQPGDDIRTIDWNVTARMNRPYIKNFREEREITMTLLVDISRSTRTGSGSTLKSDLIAEISAMLAFSAIKNNDKVGLILFSDKVHKYIPAQKGTRHVLKIIRELLTTPQTGTKTDVGAALSYLGLVQHRSGICFVLSDFLCPDFTKQARLTAARNDLVCIALTDKSELAFPVMNMVRLQDPETGETHMVNTSSDAFQKNFSQTTASRLRSLKRNLIKLGGDFCALQTDKPYYTQLRKFFMMRQMRRR